MASSLLASQTPILKNPNFLSPPNSIPIPKPLFFNLSKPKTITFVTHPKIHTISHKKLTISAYSSSLFPSTKSSNTSDPTQTLLSGSTRTLTTLLAITLAASKVFAIKVVELGLQLKGLHGLQQAVVYTAGPAFFAAARDRPTRYLNTPMTVVAAGLAKWLDIYSGVLMVRVLLSWFPNIPWEKQPLSAIRDLCDPYLNLFRNIIPPVFDVLDVSPLLAFAVLGGLSSMLNSSRGAY